MASMHPINIEIVRGALERMGISQAELASRLGEPAQNISRWLKAGYPAAKVRTLARELELGSDDFRRLIGAPVYSTFFRKKYKGAPSDDVRARAVAIARFWFARAGDNAPKAPIPDLSGETSADTVATAIRGLTQVSQESFSYAPLRRALGARGVTLVPLSFVFFGLRKGGEKDNQEHAVTVSDGAGRYVILLDADVNEALLTFNLCHELAHVFRPNAEQGKVEEALCNAVASELLYPRDIVLDVLKWHAGRPAFERLEAVHRRLGGSRLGIILAIKKHKAMKQAEILRLWRPARALEAPVPGFHPSTKTREAIGAFFDAADQTGVKTGPWADMKLAAMEDALSGRALAEMLGVESHVGTLIVDEWRRAVESPTGAVDANSSDC